MSLSDGDHQHYDAELLQAQAHVWNHIFNFINSMSLKCAIDLGIPDAIHNHGKPMVLSELVSALNIHKEKAPFVSRLMRIMVHSGFFLSQKVGQNDQEEKYGLTTASKLLLKDNPLSVAPFALAMLDPTLTKPWDYLSTWFQNSGETPFAAAHGLPFWDYFGNRPKLNHMFNEGMASDARFVANVLTKRYKGVFEGLKSLVDVGGGTGTLAKAIAKEFPHMDCTVFDLPHVVADLHSHTENLKFLGGDMFEAVPPANAILLKWILHDWSDEECVKILKQCKEAIKGEDGGKVMIIDMVVGKRNGDGHESTETQLFFDMLMMILATGQEREEKQWAKLFADAGFSSYKITPILGLRSLIEVSP